jgi:hypothetical protein
MRAICESCLKPQPPDWRAGDLCVWCGQAVRREVRCFWCAKWTPAVKFCRTCGAATVDGSLYGAARMLKDAGSDRFSIPRQLAEFDPDQIENFTRIFQEQAVTVGQHVAQVEFLERYLEQKHWSAALDEMLAPQLPWPQERFDSMRAAARLIPAQEDGLAKARAIYDATPLPGTRILAAIARVALEDWAALEEIVSLLDNPDQAVRTEAVLSMSHWRVLYGPGLPPRRDRIVAELRTCPLREAASIRLALLGEPAPLPLPPGDFAAALVTGDADFLAAAAAQSGDALRRLAAARRLISLERLAPAGTVLESAPEAQQIELLELLERRRKPALELRDTLFALAGRTLNERVRRFACFVLCYGCPPEEALRIARAAEGDRSVYQALLQKAGLQPGSLEDLGAFLMQSNTFRMSQFGLADSAKKGRMPADFVQRHWSDADNPTRVELCKFAEAQLMDYGDEALHCFLAGIAFSPGPVKVQDVKVQSEAWSSLYRWYDSFGFPRRRPLTIAEASIGAFFGTARQFLVRFAQFLEGREILRENLHRDRIAQLLRYPDASALPLFAQEPREAMGLADALTGVMRDGTVDLILRLACADFLAFLGSVPAFRSSVIRLLQGFAGTDLDLQSKNALERITSE